MVRGGLNPGYASGISDTKSKERYEEKLQLINGINPYEMSSLGDQWEDNTEKWPAIMYVNICMYLILCPSPYTKDDMLNYNLEFRQLQELSGRCWWLKSMESRSSLQR